MGNTKNVLKFIYDTIEILSIQRTEGDMVINCQINKIVFDVHMTYSKWAKFLINDFSFVKKQVDDVYNVFDPKKLLLLAALVYNGVYTKSELKDFMLESTESERH